MNVRSGFGLRIFWYILFSGGKAGTIGGINLGFFAALLLVIEEIIRFDQSNKVFLLIFPYFMLLGTVVGLLVGITIGLVFAIILFIYWPIKTVALKKYCLAVGGIMGAVFPLIWFVENIRIGNHSEYIEIGLWFVLLILVGCCTGFIAWKTFANRMAES